MTISEMLKQLLFFFRKSLKLNTSICDFEQTVLFRCRTLKVALKIFVQRRLSAVLGQH